MASREARALKKAESWGKLGVAMDALQQRMTVPARPQAHGRHDPGLHFAKVIDWLSEVIVLAAGRIYQLEARIQELERELGAQQEEPDEPKSRARKT